MCLCESPSHDLSHYFNFLLKIKNNYCSHLLPPVKTLSAYSFPKFLYYCPAHHIIFYKPIRLYKHHSSKRIKFYKKKYFLYKNKIETQLER